MFDFVNNTFTSIIKKKKIPIRITSVVILYETYNIIIVHKFVIELYAVQMSAVNEVAF